MKRILSFLVIAGFMTISTGCEVTRGPVRIGIKSFEEQRILSTMISMVIEQEGFRSTVLTCGDTYSCQREIQNGNIDVMIEYTGTALTLAGVSTSSEIDSIDNVRDFYKSTGLRWLVDLGFENDYVVVVSAVTSAARDIVSIPDLAKIGGDIKMAVDPAYVRRPGDGLYPLVRRYGLTLDGNPLLIQEPNARYRAVLEGRADAAVGYKTDGFLAGEQLRILSDPQSFFRTYRAGIVVSNDALTTYPDLEKSLISLEDQLGTYTMRLLNEGIQIEGRSPERLALEFLRSRGLIKETYENRFGRPELYIVSTFNDQPGPHRTRALDIVSKAFPDYAVRHQNVYDPAESLAEGRARLALMGAEDFFTTISGITIKREERIEAVSVVGNRFIHIIQRKNMSNKQPFVGRFGIVSTGYRSSRIGSDILKIAGVESVIRRPPKELLKSLINGEIDKAIIVSEAPDPLVTETLAENPDLELMSIPESWIRETRVFIAPYLRSARIPGNMYPGQDEGVSTLSAQVVLAAPSKRQVERTHIGGLVSAVRVGGVPLTTDEAQRLLTAGVKTEMPDPVLPSYWSLRYDTDQWGLKSVGEITEIVLSLFAVFYIIVLVAILNQQFRIRNKDNGS